MGCGASAAPAARSHDACEQHITSFVKDIQHVSPFTLISLRERVGKWRDAIYGGNVKNTGSVEDLLEAVETVHAITSKLKDRTLTATSFDSFFESSFNDLFGISIALIDILHRLAKIVEHAESEHVQRVIVQFSKEGGLLLRVVFERADGIQEVALQNTYTDCDGKSSFERSFILRDGEYIISVNGRVNRDSYGECAHTVCFKTNTCNEYLFESDCSWHNPLERYSYSAKEGEELVEIETSGNSIVGTGSHISGIKCLAHTASVRKALNDTKSTRALIEIAGIAGQRQGQSYHEYAFMEAMHFGHADLEIFQTYRKEIVACSEADMPEFWDKSSMQVVQPLAGVGDKIELEGAYGQNLFSKVELGEDTLSFLQMALDSTVKRSYTRDRRGGRVPTGFKLRHGVLVQNALNWKEFKVRTAAIGAYGREQARKEKQDKVAWAPSEVHPPKTESYFSLAGKPQFHLDAESNCAWLFHGTNEKAATAITAGDFRIDRAGSNAGTLYGPGLYFAESISKADEYTKKNSENLHCVLLCRVALGMIKYCDAVMLDSSFWLQTCIGPKATFHSVLGDREKMHGTFREFVVYDDDQVYPEYVLWYERLYDESG